MTSGAVIREAFERWRGATADDAAWTAQIRVRGRLPLVRYWKVVANDLLWWAFRAGYEAAPSRRETRVEMSMTPRSAEEQRVWDMLQEARQRIAEVTA